MNRNKSNPISIKDGPTIVLSLEDPAHGLSNLSGLGYNNRMKLAYEHFPKRNYIQGATPLQYASRLTNLLGGPDIYIKRDDTLEGGNKTRKLEFVLGEALARHADSIITCGSIQSNHCRAALGFANREGIECHLILKESIPGTFDPEAGGNNLLYHLLGASSIRLIPWDSDLDQAMEEKGAELRRQGENPFLIPTGASTPQGCLGYVCAARELLSQAEALDITLDHIIVPSGSGGTQAGLVVGFQEAKTDVSVIGINVVCGRREQEEKIQRLAVETMRLLESSQGGKPLPVRCIDDYLGEGYTFPTRSMVTAVKILARTESLLLDPIYSGKAMAGLIDLSQKRLLKKGETIVFLHTGGLPTLFEYGSYFLPKRHSKEI